MAEFVKSLLGTAAESVIDTASFGVFKPDIIDEEAERQNRWASTIGHIVGNVAGFVAPGVGSISTAARAVKVLGKTATILKLGSKISKATMAAEAIGISAKTASIGAGVFTSFARGGAAMAFHDAAREVVSQVQQNEPDLFQVGKKAIQGGFLGGLTGYVGNYVNMEGPLTQGASMGVTFAAADAMIMASDGVKPGSEEFNTQIASSFLMGAVMGAFQSRGYKQRRAANNMALGINNLDDLIRGEIKSIKKTRTPGGADVEEVVYKTIIDKVNEVKPELFKDPEVSKAIMGSAKIIAKTYTAPGALPPNPKGKIRALANELGWVKGKDASMLNEFIKQQTGKDTLKKATEEEIGAVWDGLITHVNGELSKATGFTGIKIQPAMMPADRQILKSGMQDMVSFKKLWEAGMLRDVERIRSSEMRYAFERQYREAYYEAFPDAKPKGIKGKVKRVAQIMRDETDEAAEELFKTMTFDKNKPPSDMNQESIRDFSKNPKLKEVVDSYKRMTDFYWNRLNQVNLTMGKDPVPYNEFYIRHLVDEKAMIRAGIADKVPKPKDNARRGDPKSTGVFSVSTEKARAKGETGLIYHKDPFKAMDDMIRQDLKAVYLEQPVKLFTDELNAIYDAGGMSRMEYDYVTEFTNTVIRGLPSKGTLKGNAWVERHLDNAPGKAITKYAAEVGLNLRSRPLETLNRLWGAGVTNAYIGARIRLAIRNQVQSAFTWGMTNTKSTARGMATELSGNRPALVNEWRKTSSFFKVSMGQGGVEHGAASNAMEELSHAAFTKAHKDNIGVASTSTYYQTIDNINNTKLGWDDATGRSLRTDAKKAGQKDWREVLSPKEKSRLFEEMDFVAAHTQFLYTTMGMPTIFRDARLAPFFKLMSFPMNYAYKYVGEMGHRAITGQPTWAKGTNIKLPMSQRMGIVNHFVLFGGMVAALDAAGLNYTSMIGAGIKPSENKAFVGPFTISKQKLSNKEIAKKRGISEDRYDALVASGNKPSYKDEYGWKVGGGQEGTLTARPSPLMSIFASMSGMMSESPYERKKATGNFWNSINLMPGRLAAGDVTKAVKEGEVSSFLLYKNPKPKVKPFKIDAYKPYPFKFNK